MGYIGRNFEVCIYLSFFIVFNELKIKNNLFIKDEKKNFYVPLIKLNARCSSSCFLMLLRNFDIIIKSWTLGWVVAWSCQKRDLSNDFSNPTHSKIISNQKVH